MTTQAILRTLELLYSTHELPVACFQENLSLLHAYCSCSGYAPVFSAMAGRAPDDQNISLVSGYAGLYGAVRIRGKADISSSRGPSSTRSRTKLCSMRSFTTMNFPGRSGSR